MERYASVLREIAERASLKPVKEIALLPGMKAVYRVTLHYFDFRASDSVVTVCCGRSNDALSEAVYVGRFGNRPLTRTLGTRDYENFVRTIMSLSFDKLPDQQHIPVYGADVCMVERAAGTFVKGVIFAPQKAEGHYHTLFAAIKTYLPEALREMV
ncbi:MAG: hypothetical protein SF029_14735 [bacterium]|nr:hypothetical protein [bacterium]